MTAQRSQIAGVLAIIAVLGGFWMLVIAPKREKSAAVAGQLSQARQRLAAATSAAGHARNARAAYQRQYATLARLGKAVPADDDVASLLFQLESVAKSSKIDFRAFQLVGGGSAATTTTPPAADAKKAGVDAKTATGADKTATSSADGTASAPAAPAISQAPPGATVGAAGLLTMPFTFTFDGGYLPMQRLLGSIDRLADTTGDTIFVNGRLLTVDGFSLVASRHGFPKVKAQVSATSYILPASQSPTLLASPSAPAATSPAPGGSTGAATAPPTATATIQGARP